MRRWFAFGLPVRLSLFIIFQGVMLAVLVELTINAGLNGVGSQALTRLLKENQTLEWAQIVLLILSVALGWGVLRKGAPALHRLLCLMLGVPFFRELDALLQKAFWEDFHHLLILAVVALAALFAIANRRELVEALPGFVLRPGFYFMLFGVLLIGLYAQILGQREVWKILAPFETSFAKRFVEEGLELMGYFCILLGLVEELYFSGRTAPGASRSEGSR